MLALSAVFAMAVTVHNLEEILSPLELPPQFARLGVTQRDHQVAVVALTLALYIVVAVALSTPAGTLALAGCAAVMVLNAFVPHAVLTIIRRRYSPGTMSGLLLTAPAGIALLSALIRAGSIGPLGILGATAGTALAAALLIVVTVSASVVVRRSVVGG